MCAHAWSQLKDAVGMGTDAEDASWLSISQLNRETHVMEKRVRVLLVVWLLGECFLCSLREKS